MSKKGSHVQPWSQGIKANLWIVWLQCEPFSASTFIKENNFVISLASEDFRL